MAYNYNPMPNMATYADARSATYNSAATAGSPVPALYQVPMTTTPGYQQQRGGGGGGNFNQRGGGGGGGQRRPKQPKVYTCAQKHPINALKTLYPDAKFEMACSYMTNKGAALVYTVNIQGVTYQGEGISSSIARAIAASKALAGVNAVQHEHLQVVADYDEQKRLVLDRVAEWQHAQEQKELTKKAREERAAERMEVLQANKKLRENNGTAAPVPLARGHQDYGFLMILYGPDVYFEIVQSGVEDNGTPTFSCDLHVQGFTFTGTGSSKKLAKGQSVAKAYETFETSPPPVVNDRKRKRARRGEHDESSYVPVEPVEFQDKLAVKCWNFVSEQLADIPAHIARRRNLVVMVKVEGEEQLDNCEIVSFGSGTLCVKMENMSATGEVIDDCTGDSLALRAFRRYLLDQIELCLKNNKTSIYQKDRGGRCTLKKGIAFYMYTNSTPFGDCRSRSKTSPAIGPAKTLTDENVPKDPTKMQTDESEATDPTKMQTDENTNVENKQPHVNPNWKRKNYRPRFNCTEEDLGKIQIFGVDEEQHASTEITFYPSRFTDENKGHCIVSPSDKLALRQIVGVQGSMLSMLSNPIYISTYLVNRAFDETALTRALYGRVSGASTNAGQEPKLLRVLWKTLRSPEPRSKWAFVWAKEHSLEFIYAATGKKMEVTAADTDPSTEVDPALGNPSLFCTFSLYTAFANVCKGARKSVQKYNVIKNQKSRYHDLKQSVKSHLETAGQGTWPAKPVQPAF